MIFLEITSQYIDKFRFCVKILCLNGLKLPLKSRSSLNFQEIAVTQGKKSNQKCVFYFLFDYELCYRDSEKHCFFVLCEVILTESTV
jgi:hypothetical protein